MLERREEQLGRNHLQSLTAARHLAKCLRLQQKFSEAEDEGRGRAVDPRSLKKGIGRCFFWTKSKKQSLVWSTCLGILGVNVQKDGDWEV